MIVSGSITSSRRSTWAPKRTPLRDPREERRRRLPSASSSCSWSSASGRPPASAIAAQNSSNESWRSSSLSFSERGPKSAFRSSLLRCSSRLICSALYAFSASSRAARASAVCLAASASHRAASVARRAARSSASSACRAASAAETTSGDGEPALLRGEGVVFGMANPLIRFADA